MRPIYQLAAALACLSLGGCLDELTERTGSYEIREVKGDVYLLNKKTGQTLVKSGDRLSELKRYDETDLRRISARKNPTVRPVKGLDPYLKIKYRDNAMQFEFELTGQPLIKQDASGKFVESEELIDKDWKDYWGKEGNFLVLKFEDSDGFGIASQHFALGGNYKTASTQIVDSKDNVTGFRYVGQLAMTPERYADIVKGSLTYNLEKPAKK